MTVPQFGLIDSPGPSPVSSVRMPHTLVEPQFRRSAAVSTSPPRGSIMCILPRAARAVLARKECPDGVACCVRCLRGEPVSSELIA